MDLNYGINGDISVASSTPVVMCVSANIDDDSTYQKFNNADVGLEWCEENSIDEGTMKDSLKAISLQGVNCPIVCFIVKYNIDESINKTNILASIDEIKICDGLTGIEPDLILAPYYSWDIEVASKLTAVAKKLFITTIVDCLHSDEAEAMEYVSNFSSRHLLIYGVSALGDERWLSPSALMAGLIARYDSDSYGWAKSHSNRVVQGVVETKRVIEYLEGQDSEARRLRQFGIGSIVKDIGWRSYGFETTDIDPIWQSLDRVRTFYRIMRAIIKASKWARDREANQLIWVKQSISDFMNELVGNDVAIGFEVYFAEKNTKATVSAGKFYLTVKLQDMPSIRELNIELVYTDDYSDVLINMINGG